MESNGIIITLMLIAMLVGGVLIIKHNQKMKKGFTDKVNEIERFQTSNSVISCDYSTALFIDTSSKRLCLINRNKKEYYSNVIEYKDLISIEIFEDGDSVNKTVRSSQIAGAIVGNIAFGGVGAVIGGLSGKKKVENSVTRIELRLIINDTNSPLFDIIFMNGKMLKNSIGYKNVNKHIRLWNGILESVIRQG